jgi:hypothetical protein
MVLTQWSLRRYQSVPVKKRTLAFFQRIVCSSAELPLSPFFCTFFNTASSAAHRFHCVGGCWDRTQDNCDFLHSASRALNTRLDLIHRLDPILQLDLLHRLDLIHWLNLIPRLDLIHRQGLIHHRLDLIPKIMSITLLCWEVW